MRQFIVKQLGYDLTPVAGLALVGHHLQRLTPVFEQIDQALPVKTGVTNSDIVRSYVGLLVQGKSDFDAIENFRGDAFFKQALQHRRVTKPDEALLLAHFLFGAGFRPLPTALKQFREINVRAHHYAQRADEL